MTRLILLSLAALLLGACQPTPSAPAQTSAAAASSAAELDQPVDVTPPATAASLYAAELDQVLAGGWRSAAHKARDGYRHPAATLAFFAVQPDMTVVEINPGGGWYTEVLAPWLNADGHFIAAIARSDKPDSLASKSAATLTALFQAHPAQFDHATIERYDPAAPVFGPPASADRVLTFRNVHNWASAGTAAAMFKGFFAVLKPGGVLGVTDHRAEAGATFDQVKDTGYVPVGYVVKLATDAGFVLEEQSEINANPADDHNHPKGVWTLPPTLALGAEDEDKYRAIGESDRMTLRFVKPRPDVITHAGMESSGMEPAPEDSAGTERPR